MLKEFKSFILRGNAVDLAVGVVIGAAFGTVVNSIVANLLTPLTTIWQSCPAKDEDPAAVCPNSFEDLAFTLGNSTFAYGRVMNAIISFILIGAAVFFFVVRPLNALEDRRKRTEPEPESPTRACPECLSEIPKKAVRCSHCAIKVPAEA